MRLCASCASLAPLFAQKEKEKEKARRDSSEPALENTLLLADNALLLFESGIALQPWANTGDQCGRVFRCLRDLPIGLKFRTPEVRKLLPTSSCSACDGMVCAG